MISAMFDITESKNNPDLPENLKEEIKEIYRSQIRIPEVKPKPQFLLCPVGLVAAGKTTVVKPLAEKLNLVRVSNDEIGQILKQRGFNFQAVKDISYDLIKEFVEKGYSVAIDGNCGSEDSVNKIKEAQKEHNLKIIWLRVKPPEEFIINKLKNYKHTWLFKDGNEAVEAYFKYKEKYGDFENLDIHYTYTFDTSKPNLNDQIREAYEIIVNVLNYGEQN